MKLYYKYIKHVVNLMMYAPNRRIENMPLDGSDTIQLYKGVDSKIEFVIKDNDRKPVSLIGKTLMTYIINTENKQNVLTRSLDYLDESKGHYELTIYNHELDNWESGYYNIIVTFIDHLGIEQNLYNEYGYHINNVIKVNDRILDVCKSSIEQTPIDWLIGVEDYYYSSVIKGKNQISVNDIVTMVFDLTGFTGQIEVQGCLDNTIPVNENDWINNVYFEEFDNITIKKYINIYGNYQWLRIRYKKSAGEFDKVVIRN